MPYSLLDRLSDIPLTFFDVETTGASAQWGDRIIELGIVRLHRGQVVAEYQQLLNPNRIIGAGITALTGITNEMVAGQPTFADVMPQVIDQMRDSVVVGHNVRFDLSFLTVELQRAAHDIAGVLGCCHVLDTVRLARRRFGRGGNGLQRLSRRLQVEATTAHRALADAHTTRLVFERMLGDDGELAISLVDAIAAQGGPMN
ncbi:MAG: 3'-5' exonuclease, partial [Phycisphaerae bacterium]|nr:3'-5' exonuclease [Phycisphaerae bacterium]